MIVKVLNLDKIFKELDVKGDIDMYPVIKPATQMVQKTAKQLAPVDTGRLRGSIHRKSFKKGKNSYGRVFTNVEYAPYQEFGYTRTVKPGDKVMVYGNWRTAKKGYTVNYPGRAYMRQALGRHMYTIQKEAKDYVKSYLNK